VPSCRLSAAFLAALVLSCAGPESRRGAEPATATQPSREYDASYLLTWGGQRIGHATEKLRRTDAGYELLREEHIRIRRGEELVRIHTLVTIVLDAALRPRSVAVARRGDGATVHGSAVRTDGGWRATFAGQPVRQIAADAIPMELVPLRVAEHPRFQGPVMLAGYGFATGELYTRPAADDPRRILASLVVPTGVLTNELVFDEGGLARIEAPGGVESHRVTAQVLTRPFDPPEIVDAASIPVTGRAPRGASLVRLTIEGVSAVEPPPLPAQLVVRSDTGWEITLAPGFNSEAVDESLHVDDGPDRPTELGAMADAIVRESGATTRGGELRALAHYTDRMLENDLATPTADARTAFALGRGDCTAHATVFAAFAQARDFDVRLVTGYRLSDSDAGWRLVRHRWAIARVADRWIAVDPTYGEAPADAVLLGLSIHGATAADIAMIDELTFAGFQGATASFK